MHKITYSSAGIFEVNFKLSHGSNNGHKGLNGIGVDNRSVLLTFLTRVPSLMNNFHLFDNCAFPRLSST